MVYIGSWDGFVYALDAATGKLLWKHETGGAIRSPPAINNGTLFASSNDGSLYVLNARTGQRRLRFRTPANATESTAVANGLAYFPSGGVVYAVDAGAREIPGQYQLKQVWAQFWLWQVPGIPRPPGQQGGRWRFSPERLSEGIAASLAIAPEALYVGDTQGNLYARDPLLGTELWQFRAGGGIVGSPAIVGTQVYFGSKDGFLYALDRASGGLTWKHSLGAPIEVPPVFSGERLYVRTADGRLHAIE
jgi:eukaryotic-like serine/threonine-protein kinase